MKFGHTKSIERVQVECCEMVLVDTNVEQSVYV